jgi:hypothetical protein
MMPDMRLRGDRHSLGKLVSPAVNVEKEQASEPSKKRPRKSDVNKRVSFGQVHVTYLEKDSDTPSRNTRARRRSSMGSMPEDQETESQPTPPPPPPPPQQLPAAAAASPSQGSEAEEFFSPVASPGAPQLSALLHEDAQEDAGAPRLSEIMRADELDADHADHEDVTMDMTIGVGGIKSLPGASTPAAEEDADDMDMTGTVGGITASTPIAPPAEPAESDTPEWLRESERMVVEHRKSLGARKSISGRRQSLGAQAAAELHESPAASASVASPEQPAPEAAPVAMAEEPEAEEAASSPDGDMEMSCTVGGITSHHGELAAIDEEADDAPPPPPPPPAEEPAQRSRPRYSSVGSVGSSIFQVAGAFGRRSLSIGRSLSMGTGLFGASEAEAEEGEAASPEGQPLPEEAKLKSFDDLLVARFGSDTLGMMRPAEQYPAHPGPRGVIEEELKLIKFMSEEMQRGTAEQRESMSVLEKNCQTDAAGMFFDIVDGKVFPEQLEKLKARCQCDAEVEWLGWVVEVEESLAETLEEHVTVSEGKLEQMRQWSAVLKQQTEKLAPKLVEMETSETSTHTLEQLEREAVQAEQRRAQTQSQAELADRKRAQCAAEVKAAQEKVEQDKQQLASQHEQLRQLELRAPEESAPAALPLAQVGLQGDDMIHALQAAVCWRPLELSSSRIVLRFGDSFELAASLQPATGAFADVRLCSLLPPLGESTHTEAPHMVVLDTLFACIQAELTPQLSACTSAAAFRAVLRKLSLRLGRLLDLAGEVQQLTTITPVQALAVEGGVAIDLVVSSLAATARCTVRLLLRGEHPDLPLKWELGRVQVCSSLIPLPRHQSIICCLCTN